MDKTLVRILIVLAVIVALSIWMASAMKPKPKRHWVDGIIQPAQPLVPQIANLQPSTSKPSQPLDISEPAVPLSEQTQQLHPAAEHLIGPGSLPPKHICSMSPILPGCPTGHQYGGMTIMAQDLYPNSYVPAAIYNSSAFVPGCEGFGYEPEPCFQ